MQKNENLITALYERLSRDDDQQGDSNSIVNQKSYLTTYAADHGFAHYRHYTDDGYSGGNFERPGWKQLVADIDAGLVGTVIAKDLSRVGRDYIQTGFYTEVYFRRKGVRFIAIGNGVDTVNPISSEFAPFMNVLNEMYAAFYSDYICAFKDGKIAKFGPVTEVMTKETLSEIYNVDFEIMQIEGKPLTIYY